MTSVDVQVGQFRVTRVVELDRWEFTPESMFPAITDDQLEGAGLRRGHPGLVLDIATYIVRTPDQVILVDSGNGNDKQRPGLPAHHGFSTDYLDRLGNTGVRPDEIDVVVCTHLHPDHCGGNTRLVDGQWVPTFPRARYVIAETDFRWLEQVRALRSVDPVLADLAATFEDSVQPVVDSGQLELVDAPYDLAPGIRLVPHPGHTAGHLVVEACDGDRAAFFTGDVLHHPLQFADLELAQAGDADPVVAARSRHEVCSDAADSGVIVFPAHFGGAQGVRIVRAGGAFRCVEATVGVL